MIPPLSFPARAIGARDAESSCDGTNPTTIKMTIVYSIVTATVETMSPRGIFRAGFLTSPAILAVVNTPPKDTNTKPAVEKSELRP